MRVPLIYSQQTLSLGTAFQLDGAASQHLAKVLRKKEGDYLTLFDGAGLHFRAQIIHIDKKTVQVDITDSFDPGTEPSINLHLGQVMSKGDKMDWIIQKACELGAMEITPLTSERCDVKLSGDRRTKKIKHWQHIAASASEQSGRACVPKVNDIESVDTWTKSTSADVQWILHPAAPETELNVDISKPNTVSILIGPEGGFSDTEVANAINEGFQARCLGPRVLRTETAPLAALSLAQWLWGDFE